VQAKRLLLTVVEASLYHMKKEVVMSKFSPNASSLPVLRCLRLVNNELETLRDVGALLESLGRTASTIEELVVKENAVCVSVGLLQHYASSLLPNLKKFNDVEITQSKRAESIKMMGPILKLQEMSASALPAASVQQLVKAATAAGVGSSRRPGASQGQRIQGIAQDPSVDILLQDLLQDAQRNRLQRGRFDEVLARAVVSALRDAALNLNP